jgi:integrase
MAQTRRLTALGLPKLKLKTSKITGKTPKRARFSDGENLFFVIDASGSRTWSFIYSRNGKAREIGLGSYPGVELKAARDKAKEYRDMLGEGLDPKEAKEQAKKPKIEEGAITFGEAMEGFLAVIAEEWRSQRNIGQTDTLMRKHCKPILETPADQIRTKDVLAIVERMFKKTPVQGARLLRLIEATLERAYALADRDPRPANPARWKGHMAKLLPKRKRTAVKHHPAMPYGELPQFVAELRGLKGDVAAGAINVGAYALEFLLLTAARSAEVFSARWTEIDLAQRIWTVPAGRMKSDREHKVPLSGAAVAVLEAMPRVDGNPFVFPGRDRSPPRPKEEKASASEAANRKRRAPKRPAPLTPKTFERLLGKMGCETVTHGFRSSFRDWAGDCTNYPREVAEAALAHAVGDETERAYRRGDALERRRELMSAWATFLEPAPSDNVVKFPQRG